MDYAELTVREILELMRADKNFRASFTEWIINFKEKHYGPRTIH